MSPGITFRCTCDHCGATFFGPDRKANTCIKCAKRYRIRNEAPAVANAEPEDDLFAAALTSLDGGNPGGAPRRHSGPPARTAHGDRGAGRRTSPPARFRTPEPSQPKETGAHAPRNSELTEEKRAEILRAYAEYEMPQEVPLRRLHAEIAEKTHMARAVVSRVIAEVRMPPAALTEEQREWAIARYREYVRAMERPAGGRRASIARELGVSRQQVVLAVRDWTTAQPSITDLSRQDLFRIECAYWAALEAGEPYDGLAGRVASRLGYTDWEVERWVDMLHDGDFEDVQDPAPDQREAVIAAYREYLQGDGPPSRSLHAVLAERLGLGARQVHKVLVDYRLEQRQRVFRF